ncbi:glutaredoxin-like protein NrdH [Fundicoccus ignavus]|uniref:Glutaredoxin-like protein NrdH n=1 Tax=Fundicoccus ignavus TaxID=2664442 RepID=A0A6I2GFY3_9LACT|nr:glutaredoxin-like protein NrdH [Fundicoccus ignavus]MRI80462.1 glutaredoxin-like protein NrdH [Fundicoccus ignavus]MRI84712.1 glutaredoxin-like protein NrdH [Fundicoccus ignavus]MRJ47874.1 glutaredoxin-like protein NrdH [Fundicoccus ignavus]
MKNITVYSKPNCMQCTFTKKFLDEKDISYTTYDVYENEKALKTVKDLGFQSLPVVVIDGEKPFFGFRPDLLEKLA